MPFLMLVYAWHSSNCERVAAIRMNKPLIEMPVSTFDNLNAYRSGLGLSTDTDIYALKCKTAKQITNERVFFFTRNTYVFISIQNAIYAIYHVL